MAWPVVVLFVFSPQVIRDLSLAMIFQWDPAIAKRPAARVEDTSPFDGMLHDRQSGWWCAPMGL